MTDARDSGSRGSLRDIADEAREKQQRPDDQGQVGEEPGRFELS
jgi:hypothetical protein